MDKLTQILSNHKPTKKIVENRQVLARRKEDYEQEQRLKRERQTQQVAKRDEELRQFYEYDLRRKVVKTEQTPPQLPLKSEEVQAELGLLHQPLSLQGETELQRYKRYLKLAKFHKENPDYDMKAYDEEFYLKFKERQEFQELDSKYRARMIEPQLGDDPNFLAKKKAMIAADKDQVPFQNICDEIYLWISKLLCAWTQALELKYSDQAKERGTKSYAIYSETVEDIRGFLYVLKKRGGDRDMVTSVYHIMNNCLIRDYIAANDRYILLSIGNAPWPMGEAMLSLTVKRNAQRLSHVLTDTVTRKWMQAVKRLITVSQQLYPNPDKLAMVFFSINQTI